MRYLVVSTVIIQEHTTEHVHHSLFSKLNMTTQVKLFITHHLVYHQVLMTQSKLRVTMLEELT